MVSTSVVDEELRRLCEEVALNSTEDWLLDSSEKENSLFELC